jgi:membrane complex biogenesis BtpA family protein
MDRIDVLDVLDVEAPVVGMVHLPALPGAPDSDGDLAAVVERALADARALEAGGVDAVLVENFGDAPFYPDAVPSHVVASMTRVATEVRDAVDVPLGVNVLRNDADAALAVAAAVDAAFVRVNVHAGARLTDQGIVEGRAHETLRRRAELDADVAVLADVAVKHSAALADRPLDEVVAETLDRGRADGLVVSGPGTGRAVDADRLDAVVELRDELGADAPVFVGSGVTPANAADLLAVADGAVVGSAFEEGGEAGNPVDRERVAALVDAV